MIRKKEEEEEVGRKGGMIGKVPVVGIPIIGVEAGEVFFAIFQVSVSLPMPFR